MMRREVTGTTVRIGRWLWVTGVVAAVALGCGWSSQARAAGSGSAAVSKFSVASYTAGKAFTVTITVTPAAGASGYALEDKPPAGWSVASITEGGSWDKVNAKVKWAFLDGTGRTLSYQVTPPAGAGGKQTFAGTYSSGGRSQAVAGDRQIAP